MSGRAPRSKGRCAPSGRERGERRGAQHRNIGATESARVRHKQSAIVDYDSDIARRVSARKRGRKMRGGGEGQAGREGGEGKEGDGGRAG